MLISVAQAQLFFLALTRILAIVIHVPVIAGPLIPNQVKIGFGVLLAMVLIPWQPLPPETSAMAILPFTGAIARELLIGTLAGFAAALTFAALQIAGEMISVVSGFTAGKILNPALESSGSSIDQFFLIVTMLIFLIMNGHHGFLLGIKRTFDYLPVNSPIPDLTSDYLLRLFAQFITAGIQMAFPVIGALLLADLTLGLFARVAPQVQVFFLGIPLKVAIGLIALAMTFGLLLPTFSQIFGELGREMLKLIGA